MWNKKEMSQLDATLTKVPLTLTFDLDLWPWIFQGQVISREREARLSWNEMDGSRYDTLMWYTAEMRQLHAVLTGYLWLWIFKVKLYFGIGGPIVKEWKGQESIACPDVKHNHCVTPRQRILLPTGWLKMSAFLSSRLVSQNIYYSYQLYIIHHDDYN